MSSQLDCHFFINSACTKGDKCQFRHSEGAKSTQEVCSHFKQTGQCPEEDCGKRHVADPAARVSKQPSQIPCRNEANGGVCTRPDCFYMHKSRDNQQPAAGTSVRPTPRPGINSLNARAKEFVPQQARPRPNMEWTPAGGSGAQPRPQARTFGNKEWTPASAGQSAARPPAQTFGNKEWTPALASQAPAARPQAQTFGNKEWTPTSASTGQKPATRPPAKTFGNKEWTPASANKTSAAISSNAINSAPISAFGQKAAASAFGAGSAFGASGAFAKTSAFGGKSGGSAFGASTGASAFPAKLQTASTDASMYSGSDMDGDMDVDTTQATEPATFQRISPVSAAPISKPPVSEQPVIPKTVVSKPAVQRPPVQKPMVQKPASASSIKPTNLTGSAKPSAIPTIYDILGISENKPAPPVANQRRPRPVQSNHVATQSAVPRAAQPSPVSLQTEPAQMQPPSSAVSSQTESVPSVALADRSMSNSPSSNVCYASSFPSYTSAAENSASEVPPKSATPEPQQLMPPAVTPSQKPGESKDDTFALVVPPIAEPTPKAQSIELQADSGSKLSPPLSVASTNTPSPDTPQTSVFGAIQEKKKRKEALANALLSDTGDSSGNESSVPKMLSFEQIIARKRRKQAEAAEAARIAAGKTDTAGDIPKTSTPPPATPKALAADSTPQSTTRQLAKRRVIIDDSDNESSVSESKRAKLSSEPMIDYVAMFEKELADMSADLSGPLENSPATDRISRANIKDTYVEFDINKLLYSAQ